ncbi:MAG: ExbD/TolR family protein [Luteimonas sp.]|nr:ExbD/TolR family protein [Luteimonas sp.]
MAGSVINRKRRKLKSEINVVPYIDVMLVLLIIFMVTAPLLTLSVDVKLPSSDAARATSDSRPPTIVIAYTDGRYGLQLEGASQPDVFDDAGLAERIAAFRRQQGDDLRIMVAADRDTPYQRVMDAMALLQKSGVKNVSLISTAGGNAR